MRVRARPLVPRNRTATPAHRHLDTNQTCRRIGACLVGRVLWRAACPAGLKKAGATAGDGRKHPDLVFRLGAPAPPAREVAAQATHMLASYAKVDLLPRTALVIDCRSRPSVRARPQITKPFFNQR